MKNNVIVLITIFFSSKVVFAGPGSHDSGRTSSGSKPEIALDYSSLNLSKTEGLQEKYFEKKLVNKPEYLINSHLGTFQTSFLIDLPKNDFIQKGLRFDYNSSQNQNYGLGTGFSINLPKINFKNNKIFYNLISNNELVEVKNDLDISVRLQLVAGALNKNFAVKKYYRLKDEEDFSLFVQVAEGYLQISPDGQTRFYGNEGLLLAQVTINKKVLNFSYNDLRLVSLNSSSENWSVDLNYKEDEAQYKFQSGNFFQIPRGLNWINVKQNQTVRRYSFGYKNDLLTSVKKQGALHDLFTADYHVQKGKVTQEPYNGSALKEKIVVFKSKDKIAAFEDKSTDKDKIVMAVDINGDFVTDEITFIQTENEANIRKKFKELFANTSQVSCDERFCSSDIIPEKFEAAKANYSNYLNSQKMNLTVKIGKFDNGQYQLENEPSLSMAFKLTDMGKFTVSGAERVDVKFEQLRVPRFIDINNDGKKDLLLVSSHAEKDFLEKNKSQDILVLSAFNLLKRPSEDNIFNYEGDVPLAFLFKTDEEKIAKLSVDENADLYFIPNVSYWEKIIPQFKLNSQSMLIDYNHDGYTDVLTGKKIYLLGDNGESRSEVLTDLELKKIFDVSQLTEDSLSKLRYGLVDTDGNGVWTSYVANNYYVMPTDRKLHIISDDKDVIMERPSDVPLLTSLKSSFGGLVKVEYDYIDGAYAVKKVAHLLSELDQNNWEENFSYEGSKWHVQKNIFLGFKKGSIQTNLFSNQNRKLIEGQKKKVLEFDLDDQNGPLFYLSRARYAGRVVSEKLYNGNEVEKEIQNKYSYLVFNGRRSFSYQSSQKVSEKGKDSLKTFTSFSEYLNDIPLIERNEKISGKNIEINHSSLQMIPGMYLIRPSISSKTNQLGEKRLIESNTWNANGQLISRITPDKTENYTHDSAGRVAGLESSNGQFQYFEYEGNLPLVKSVTVNDMKTRYYYSEVENDVVKMSLDGFPDQYSFAYTTDAVLLKILKNDQTVFEQTMSGNKLIESVVLDEKFSLKLDSFGRVVTKTQHGTGDNLVLFTKSFDDQDRAIVEFSPVFENSYFPSATTEKRFDTLGVVINENKQDDSGNNLSEISLVKGLCSEKISEIGFREVYCSNGNGDIKSSSIPNESGQFEYSFSGEVIGIKPFGHSYKRNDNGDIIESESADWGKFTRDFNYSTNTTSYNDGVKVSLTPFGELKTYSNGLSNSLGVFTSADYKQRQLQSLTVRLGDKQIIQKYYYNPSRMLDGKTEFNTSWKFELDQFDRVSSETIKDINHEYSLNYKRVNGLITEVAPYITTIGYSPLKKPALIEFSSGASIEYEYGPRGELLGYSLTRGMIVIYRVKFEYRSDLKLISQNVITNTKLEAQIQTFSYDNKFEVSKKPMKVLVSRDNRGQIGHSGDLDFGYHHLDLIRIEKEKSGLTNYYGDSNRFIGTCSDENICFYKVSPTEVKVNGELQKLIMIGGVPAGILFAGNFYPAIIDHKMSVIGLLDSEGKKIKFLRSFDNWGNLISVSGDQSFEKNIAFSFAGLLQNPLVENFSKTKMYFSETRVYLPALGQWMSPDSTVIWQPDMLVKMPGNWNPYLYAGNDPLNITDPTGKFGVSVNLDATGGLMIGGTGSQSLVVSVNLNVLSNKFLRTEVALMSSESSKIGIGGGASLGTSFGVFIGNNNIQDIKNAGPWGVTADLSLGVVGAGGGLGYGEGVLQANLGYKGLGLGAFIGATYNNESTVQYSRTVAEGFSIMERFYSMAKTAIQFSSMGL